MTVRRPVAMSQVATTSLRRLIKPISAQILRSIVIIAAIGAINFVIVHLAPGDVADVLAGESGAASPDFIADLRMRFGLDQPLWTQFLLYMVPDCSSRPRLFLSFQAARRISDLRAIARDAGLAHDPDIAAFLCGRFGLGDHRVAPRGRVERRAVSIAALVFYAMPIFWIGMMMIVLFSVKLGWLPTDGMVTIGAGYTGVAYVLDVARHMVLPVVTLSLFHMAFYARLVRASMLEDFQSGFRHDGPR